MGDYSPTRSGLATRPVGEQVNWHARPSSRAHAATSGEREESPAGACNARRSDAWKTPRVGVETAAGTVRLLLAVLWPQRPWGKGLIWSAGELGMTAPPSVTGGAEGRTDYPCTGLPDPGQRLIVDTRGHTYPSVCLTAPLGSAP